MDFEFKYSFNVLPWSPIKKFLKRRKLKKELKRAMIHTTNKPKPGNYDAVIKEKKDELKELREALEMHNDSNISMSDFDQKLKNELARSVRGFVDEE